MRILINASTSIGDSLYFSFMLENINRLYPTASFQVMCWQPMFNFYKSFPFIEQVIPYDVVSKDQTFAFFLLRPKVDLYIDLQHTEESATIAELTGAKECIGVNPHPETYKKYSYVIAPRKGEQLKEAFFRGFKEYWPTETIEPELTLSISDHNNTEALSLLLENNILPDTKFVIIHPGAKGNDKLWLNEKWAQVAETLLDAQYKVVLIGSHLKSWGGAVIKDFQNCAEIMKLTNNRCVNLAGKTKDFMTLAALVKKAKIYFGLDTGPTHLAAILGLPVIELYHYIDKPTFLLWKPFGKEVTVIHNENMQDVSTEEVLECILS